MLRLRTWSGAGDTPIEACEIVQGRVNGFLQASGLTRGQIVDMQVGSSHIYVPSSGTFSYLYTVSILVEEKDRHAPGEPGPTSRHRPSSEQANQSTYAPTGEPGPTSRHRPRP